MLYSGHFSFDEMRSDRKARHGYFTCMARAENPTEALEKFRDRIVYLREEEKDPLFTGIVSVYVEDIVEIVNFPEEAVITRYQSSEGQFPKSESCALPVSESKKIRAFKWVSDPEKAKEENHQEYEEAEAFLEFV